MAMSNILLKEVTIGLFLLISYDGSSLSHYESQSLPSQLEILFKVQLINVNSKMRKNLFYFLTKKGRTFPLVKISFFERY